MKQRIYALDNLKGCLILLVIIGHCIQITDADFDHNAFFRFIYSFHMPLFMWVSGYVNYRDGGNTLHVIKRRARQLALPFLSWTLLGSLIAQNPWHMVEVFFNPTLSVWFVWDLFLIVCFSTVINYCCERYEKSGLRYMMVSFIVAEIIAKGLHLDVLDISHALDMGMYYLMGYYMHEYQTFGRVINLKAGGGILFLFLVMCVFWQRKQPPTFMPDAPNAVGTLWKMLTAVMACCSIPVFFIRWGEYKVKWLTYLGTQTLGIYVSHQLVMGYLQKWADGLYIPYWCQICLLAMLTLTISQMINVLLQRNKVIGWLMLGKDLQQKRI